mgnify:FL=1
MIQERVNELRKRMESEAINAWYITGTDPHQSEYVAARWRTREFISGFSGSAGTVVITKDKALLWVDSRYYLQGEQQIKGTEYILMKQGLDGVPSPLEWLCENLNKNEKVGVDSSTVSISTFLDMEKKLKEKSISLVGTDDYLSPIWKDRPSIPCTPCVSMKDEYAGFTAAAKINFVRLKLRQEGVSWTFISSIDDIAWLTNLRANDIPCNPVFVSYLFISFEEAILFVDKKRFSKDLLKKVEENFTIKGYDEIASSLPSLTKKGVGYYSQNKCAYTFYSSLAKKKNKTGDNITTKLKARKNPVEMEGMRRAHFLDGVAFANFMASIDPLGVYSELEIARRFEDERKKMEGYLGPSFEPISAFNEHGAVVHYSPDEKSNKKVEGQGLLVLDTGSQFEFGTTDLTRTLLFGTEATEAQKKDYTLVLKGHLALARQIFPKGTVGTQLDILAKQFLWCSCENYMHGTGHGVGCRLNVHEGPCNISSRLLNVPLETGMVVSDEPGVYKAGRYGIRIENLIAVQNYAETEFGAFYNFEVLSMVPYEKKLIDVRYLTDVEISQIDAYHQWVRDQLIDYVFDETKPWLEQATSPLSK